MDYDAAVMKKIGADPSGWRWFGQDYGKYAVTDPDPIPPTVVPRKPWNVLQLGSAVVLFAAYLVSFPLVALLTTGKIDPIFYWVEALILVGVMMSFFFLHAVGWLICLGYLIMAVLMMVTGQLWNGVLTVAGMAGLAAAVFLFLLSTPTAGSTTEHEHEKDALFADPLKRVFGQAGLIAGAADKFGEGAVEAGARGEKSTAALLDLLLKIPGTAVFHGLRFPGSANADVDHAVTHGNTVFLIDSKQYRAGTYAWGSATYTETDGSTYQREEIIRDGEHVIANHMDDAAGGYRDLLGENVTVIPLVLVHGYGVRVGAKMTSTAGVHLLTPDDAMDYIGGMIADAMDGWEDSRAVRSVMIGNLKAA